MKESTHNQPRVIYATTLSGAFLIAIYVGMSDFSLMNLVILEAAVLTALAALSMLLKGSFTGVLVAPLRHALKMGSILSAVWLPLYLYSSGYARLQMITLVAVVWIVLIYISIRDAVRRGYPPLFWIVSSGTILSVETLCGVWIIMTQLPGSHGMGTTIIVSGIVSATFPLLNLLGRRGEPYSLLVDLFGKNLLRNTMLATTFFVYALFLRGEIMETLAANYSLLIFIEWTALTTSLFAAYRHTRRRITQSHVKPERRVDWRKHVQVISRFDDKRLSDWTLLIDSFVQRGEKDFLCIKLIDLLRSLQAPTSQIRDVLTGLINYHEAEPRLLSFTSNKDHLDDGVITRRKIVETVVERISVEYG